MCLIVLLTFMMQRNEEKKRCEKDFPYIVGGFSLNMCLTRYKALKSHLIYIYS